MASYHMNSSKSSLKCWIGKLSIIKFNLHISFFKIRLEEQIDVSEKLFDTYPILVYPCRIYDHGQHTGQLRPPRPDQMCPGTDWGMFNDLGVYGVPQKVRDKQR